MDDKDRIIVDAVEHLRELSKALRHNGLESLADLNDKMANHFQRRHKVPRARQIAKAA